MADIMVEYSETTSTTLEWTLRDLRHHFDSTRGEAKSKVIKSIKFGDGKWQCLFYPNSGMDAGGWISLYLSCEPTIEEKERAVDGKWVREGRFRFSFSIWSLGLNTLLVSKDADDHSFCIKTANWGWSQFSRRDSVYYQSLSVRNQDAFVITCKITSSPSPPSPPPAIPVKTVPKDLLESIGNLLDDPLYSDVQFVLPSRASTIPKTIYAAKRLLTRAEYFQSMFDCGFAESTQAGRLALFLDSANSRPGTPDDNNSLLSHFEDSDDEAENELITDSQPADDMGYSYMDVEIAQSSEAEHKDKDANLGDAAISQNDPESSIIADVERNVRPKISHPSSPRSTPPNQEGTPSEIPGPKKTKVIVRDVAYATYRAVLYYLYTDTITFAPLSSSFQSTSAPVVTTPFNSHPSASQASLLLPPSSIEQSSPPIGGSQLVIIKQNQDKKDEVLSTPRTRREWLSEWARAHPSRVLPCSAKSAYRLADKLDLKELKTRAFQHIIKSLTVSNIAYEVFSSFSATFDDVRKVQVDFFLSNWTEIRSSEAMRTVWQQIRTGRHPGFEEVWPVIVLNLEFKPHQGEKDGDSGKTSNAMDKY